MCSAGCSPRPPPASAWASCCSASWRSGRCAAAAAPAKSACRRNRISSHVRCAVPARPRHAKLLRLVALVREAVMDRRRFLKYAGCAACALGAEHVLHGSGAAAAQAYGALDPAARLKLADTALALAQAAGASYADVRVGRNQREFIRARERRLEEFDATLTVGFGVRVLIDGSWGFAGSEVIAEDEIRRAVALAVDNAKAARLIHASPIVLEEVPAYQEDWVMPMGRDPFAVSASDKAAKLI